MQFVKNDSKERSAMQLREHYLIERELADRLRQAGTEERRQLYGVVYDESSRRIAHHPLVVRALSAEQRAAAAAPQRRLLQSFVTPETDFLEIGTGDGSLAVALAKDVRSVHATDVSAVLIEGLEWPANARFYLSDGLDVPLPPESVDFAYSSQVMEHLHPEDALEQLRNIWTVLRPGGRYLCVTPNRLSGPHDISGHFDRVATGFHLNECTIAELATAFRRAGFSQVHVILSYKGYRFSPLLPVPPFALLEQVLARLPRRIRREVAHPLVAAKVIATK